MQKDVKALVLEISAQIIKLAGQGSNIEENKKKVLETIENGKAYAKFLELIENQGGKTEYLKNIPKAKYIEPLISEEEGYIESLDAEICGKVSLALGAGRIQKEDQIDHLTGLILEKKTGDKIEKGEPLAYIHSNVEEKIEEAKQALKQAYKITKQKPEEYKHVLNII